MATNAERQAAWRDRRKEELAELKKKVGQIGEKPSGSGNGGVTWLNAPEDRAARVQAAVAAPARETFERDLCRRTRALREATGLSQSDVGRALGQNVRAGTYARWEQYTPMPVYLMPTFARLVGTNLSFLLTGTTGA